MVNLKKYFLSCILALGSCFCFSQQAKIDSLKKVLLTAKEDTNKISALNMLAWQLSNINPDTSILLASQALSIAQKEKNKKYIANSYHNIAWANYLKGDYTSALENNFKALALSEELNNKQGISKTLGNIGIVYFGKGDYSKALTYYFK